MKFYKNVGIISSKLYFNKAEGKWEKSHCQQGIIDIL